MLVLTRREGQEVICMAGRDHVTIVHEQWNPGLRMVALSIRGADYFISCSLSRGRSIKVPIGGTGKSKFDSAWIEIAFVDSKCDGQRIGINAPAYVEIERDDAGPKKVQRIDPSARDMVSLTPSDQPSMREGRRGFAVDPSGKIDIYDGDAEVIA
jgi:sRNA-binding carbon storage regulator CsrA